jgi:hypothetical protein
MILALALSTLKFNYYLKGMKPCHLNSKLLRLAFNFERLLCTPLNDYIARI